MCAMRRGSRADNADGREDIGLLFHPNFPYAGVGLAYWSGSGWRDLVDWSASLGFTSVHFIPLVLQPEDPGDYGLNELQRLYHAGIAKEPPRGPGWVFSEEDRYLNNPECRRKAQIVRQAFSYAASLGLKTGTIIPLNVGFPEFAWAHPELHAVEASDYCVEGLTLCPSKPETIVHMRKVWEHMITGYGRLDTVHLWPKDFGGCTCNECMPYGKTMARLARQAYDLIREKSPGTDVVFVSWHVVNEEIPDLIAGLPRDVIIKEAPRIHANDYPLDRYFERVRMWREAGFRVESWVEIQENPTTPLPAVYPERIGRMVKRLQKEGVTSSTATAAQVPYVFPINFYVYTQLLKNPEMEVPDAVDTYLVTPFGKDALEEARAVVRAYEKSWDYLMAPSMTSGGFQWAFTRYFTFEHLPAKAIEKPLAEDTRADINRAVKACQEAVAASEALAAKVRPFQSMETNVLTASARVMLARGRMRKAKVPVLDALREGDAARAAGDAPNTFGMLDHYTKLLDWPDRLRALERQFSEVAVTKGFRDITRYLRLAEKWSNNRRAR